MPNMDYQAHFWSKVDRQGPDDCWLWTASIGSHGYGQAWDPSVVNGGVTTAPRLAYYYTHDRWPRVTRHRCPGGDNPACVNPSHLLDGTDWDNAQDRIADGRQRRGETNGNAVLTEEIVREARQLRQEGWKMQDLADRYQVNRMTLSSAITGKSWGWL